MPAKGDMTREGDHGPCVRGAYEIVSRLPDGTLHAILQVCEQCQGAWRDYQAGTRSED